MNHTTVDLDPFVSEFRQNPVKFRVLLPDGSLGLVKAYQDTPQGRQIKVQGIRANGQFRKLDSISCWFSEDELRIYIYSASINPEWPRI